MTAEKKPAQAGKPCSTCGVTKPVKRFPRRRRGEELYYADECIACYNKDGDPKLRKAKQIRDEHQAYKKLREKERKEAKERARRKINQYQRQYAKEKRVDNDAQREVVRRELAKKSLLRFTQRFTPGYEAGWVHYDICARLEQFFEDVQNKRDPRLMLFMPPRHGKSEIASIKFPAWVLGHRPDYDFIAASYAISLSGGFSHKVRSLVDSDDYQKVFPTTRLNRERMNLEGWQTTSGGVFTPAGTQGAVTGKGANILVIDDPVKDAEEADSEIIREKTWDWYGTTAHSRLAPDSGVLVIQTRWHDDDLSGRLIRHMHEALTDAEEYAAHLRETTDLPEEEIDAKAREISDAVERWDIVSYPALAEDDEYLTEDTTIYRGESPPPGATLLRNKGEALHPARFSRERLLKTKGINQKRHWSALYQQNPVPDEGLIFRKDMFRYEPHVVDWREMSIGIAFDLALGKKQTNDYTVGAVGALDAEDRLHIIDLVRARWDDTATIASVALDLYERYSVTTGHCVLGFEKGHMEMALIPELMRQAKKRGIYPVLDKELKPVTDKRVRARPLQGRMQAGGVIFPQDQPWLENVQQELLRFDGGLHDDIVDALAWLTKMAGTSFHKQQKKKVKRQKSWKDRLTPYIADTRRKHWKVA
jgi:predicted phage terminase large subunit-like protein